MAGLRHPHREDGRSAPPNRKDFQGLSARPTLSAHFDPTEWTEVSSAEGELSHDAFENF